MVAGGTIDLYQVAAPEILDTSRVEREHFSPPDVPGMF
jgi:hypothetical protein